MSAATRSSKLRRLGASRPNRPVPLPFFPASSHGHLFAAGGGLSLCRGASDRAEPSARLAATALRNGVNHRRQQGTNLVKLSVTRQGASSCLPDLLTGMFPRCSSWSQVFLS